MSSRVDDIQLIDRILAGEKHLYSEMVDRHKRYAFTVAFRILNHKPDAEEATQDAFIKAYHHLGNFNRQSKFSTWLYRIVFNTAITYKRKQKNHFQSIENAIVEYSPEGETTMELTDKRKFIDRAMSRLSDNDRLAITLFYLKEFSLEEISEITATPANTIKVRIHRARIRLAEELKNILNKEALTL